MLKKLNQCSFDLEEQKVIVSNTLENRWATFYPINKQFLKPENLTYQSQDEADYELALDENGNPYEF